jgi:5-(carboxyamino)imidazole ribonucleotide synthase
MPVVGFVGAGQLARMACQAAVACSVHVRVLAATTTDSAALVCRDVVVGDYRNYDDVAAFAAGCDVVTFDHEHVPLPVVEKLVAGGAVVRPGPHALPYVQDKLRMRARLGAAGVPVPAWRQVGDGSDVVAFAAEHGWPVVVKSAVGGYDGKGVWVVDDERGAHELVGHLDRAGVAGFVEERVSFERELAALVARTPSGDARAWPVVETVQREGVCREVLAPAAGIDASLPPGAQALALRIAAELDVVGVLAVELFERGGELLVNELAMRPHNCGHWTIDGSVTSQFEQHLRAVLGWPLGDTAPIADVAVMANVLGGRADGGMAERLRAAYAVDPGARVHLYGKQARPGRKLGHVTVVGTDLDDVRRRALTAAATLRGDDT